jgi:hypothetical protein
MVILLVLEESTKELISGIPEEIFLSTNVPSTIFFTLDGTDPDINSEMYVDSVIMPTDGLTVTLKAVAISGVTESSILEETYFTNQYDINRTRIIGDEGINLLPPGSTVIDSLSFDEFGAPEQSSSIPFADLGIKASTKTNIGENILGDSTIDFINMSVRFMDNEPPQISSPNDNNGNFDPRADLIIIDGTTEEKIENQIVRIINRPRLSMDLVSPLHTNNEGNQQLVTSHLVRTMTNPKTGIITFYYRDSRENRWIKSTQVTEPLSLNISPAAIKNRFIFRWIENRAQTKIF